MMRMIIVIPIYAVLAGCASAALFSLVYSNILYGITAPFLPLACFAFAGLAYGRMGLNAALACVIPLLLLFLPLPMATMLIFMQVIPLNLFIRSLMMARLTPQFPHLLWSPPAYAITYTALYLALFSSMLIGTESAFYDSVVLLIKDLTHIEQFADLPATASLDTMLIYGMAIVSLLLVTLTTFVMQPVVQTFGLQRRPSLRFASSEPPPSLLIGALIGFAFMALVSGDEAVAAGGMIGFFIALTPYFYTGLSFVHFLLHYYAFKRQHRALWYFIVFYGVCIGLFQFAFIAMVMIGLGRHTRLLVQYYSKKHMDR